MKKLILFCALLLPLLTFSQIANEANIPFALDTDGDGIINVIDTDDDNDGVLDNADAFPLNNTKSTATISTVQAVTSADAGCRNNGANGNRNFGIEPSSDLNNTAARYQILKFTKPAVTNILSATLTIYTNTENDALQIFTQADNSWIEGALNGGTSNGTTQGVTFIGNNTNFTSKTLIGTTGTPVGGKYTFTIPLTALPANGDFTLIVLDPSGDATIESIYTKETAGKAATIDFNYYAPITPRLVVTPSSTQTTYLAGSPFTVNFKLAQAPTGTVYIPLALSDSKASIVGDKVLVFDATNWSIDQTKTIIPLAIGQFDIAIRPLHSTDNFYNGFNNTDLLGYTIQATDVTNLGPWNIATGSTFITTLNAVSAVGSTSFKFKLLNAPVGMGIVENSGKISFSPLSHQVGTWSVVIEVTDDKGNKSVFNTSITVTNGGVPDPVGIYVIPYASTNGIGTAANPFNNIPDAVTAAAGAGGGNVYVRGGEYDLLDIQNIGTVGSASNPIVIQPSPGEVVKFNFGAKTNGFEFLSTSRYIEFKNFEIDGGTDNVDFWCLPARAFWGDESIYRGGGIAIGVNGENITIAGNYIHNCYQKAVEIRTARYLKVYDNIIHSIATTSLSGGHGIMRQQASGPLTTPDNGIDFRWDLMNNLIFNVEQRIYSWVPSKGFIDMVLDEGKPILIDDVSDPAAIAASMKARIMNNIVAYGSIDQIRLKSTNNLTVSNNTVYSASPTADGITDKVADPGNAGKFTNTIFTNNAVQTMPGTAAYELVDIITQGNATGFPPTIRGNYAAVGNILPTGVSGVSSTTGPLYIDANNGNFRLNPALGLPDTLGVPPTVLNDIDARVAKFAVQVKWDKWDNDHLKLSQTILDNIPGINDGIAGNDTVFTSTGILHLNGAARGEIEFDVVNGTWKTRTGSPSKQHFELNAAYEAWYEARNAATKNASGADYTRIRWGNSVAKQNQVFQNDWLTNSQITADTNTIIYSEDNDFTLDGDLLVDFEGYTPVVGDRWYLMQAASITSANVGQLFDRVLFEGATLTPSQYSLTIVNVPSGQAVELLILGTTLPVNLLDFNLTKIQKRSIQLNWKTYSENNSKYFIVEKSSDGNNWQQLSKINAAGNSTTTNSYSTMDNNPFNGINYYRLKQIDVDGRFTYSRILTAITDDTKQIELYPNPVVNFLVVKGLPSNTATLQFVVKDVTGRQLINFTNNPSSVVDVSILTQGTYFLQVYENNSLIYSSKFVKTK
jgi:hypothetical protein